MKVVGCLLFLVALIFYFMTWREIWRLVDESRTLVPSVRFNRFWWTPAWKVHRTAYPERLVRRRIILSFLMTFGAMILAMACIGYSLTHALP